MTRTFFCPSILLAALMVFLAPTTQAQITAPGPYYAVPSWDQTFPTATRFVILSNMNSEAVLDRETGLVWERTVASTVASWNDAQRECLMKHVGGRRGWRLAKIHELMTLMDVPNLPLEERALPPGHPFDVSALAPEVQQLWSATSIADPPGWARTFHLAGNVFGLPWNATLPYWCVRGHDGP